MYWEKFQTYTEQDNDPLIHPVTQTEQSDHSESEEIIKKGSGVWSMEQGRVKFSFPGSLLRLDSSAHHSSLISVSLLALKRRLLTTYHLHQVSKVQVECRALLKMLCVGWSLFNLHWGKKRHYHSTFLSTKVRLTFSNYDRRVCDGAGYPCRNDHRANRAMSLGLRRGFWNQRSLRNDSP